MNEVYVKLDEELLEVIDKLENITVTNYKKNNVFIDIESLVIALRDLMYEYDVMKEKYEDEIKYIKDNVKEYWC